MLLLSMNNPNELGSENFNRTVKSSLNANVNTVKMTGNKADHVVRRTATPPSVPTQALIHAPLTNLLSHLDEGCPPITKPSYLGDMIEDELA